MRGTYHPNAGGSQPVQMCPIRVKVDLLRQLWAIALGDYDSARVESSGTTFSHWRTHREKDKIP